MDFKTIKLSFNGAVATLSLNRPERLNALNATVHAEIRDALSAVEGNAAIRCLVITGEGRAFCSGQDLTERVMSENTQIDTGASLDRDYNPLVRRLVSFPIPTIAAVNGPAVGAGANLALFFCWRARLICRKLLPASAWCRTRAERGCSRASSV
jgi:2-(1,2-epoxy-1,2-dihydrophenyl)acetyl-CoA isomerase